MWITAPTIPPEGKSISNGEDTLLLSTELAISHYHINMKALMLLGDWFDTLRQQGLYDNTRIIIVSDHGRILNVFDKTDSIQSTELYRPLLMVKDFNATGITFSEDFMTNADVPLLAMEGLIEDPVNPFTGQQITDAYKTERDRHYVIVSSDWDVNFNKGTQFKQAIWAAVSGDPADRKNWEFSKTESVLPPQRTDTP